MRHDSGEHANLAEQLWGQILTAFMAPVIVVIFWGRPGISSITNRC